MKKSTKRKVSMYRMVIDVLNEYQPVWEGTPRFVAAHSELTSKFEQLEIHAEKERAYTLGVKESRDSLRNEVAALGVRIAAAITAYAEEQGDLELIAQMRISESQLRRYSHSDTIILLDRIRLHATEHAQVLVEYGINSSVLDSFLQKRDELMVNIMMPRKAILKRKDSAHKIALLTDQIDRILKNKVDKLVKVLRPESESMYIEYASARMILDYGHSAPSGDATL